jgi:hypothetical protein
MGMDNMRPKLLDHRSKRADNPRIRERRVERPAGITVDRVQRPTPACDPVHCHIAVKLYSSRLTARQGSNPYLMTAARELLSQLLDL